MLYCNNNITVACVCRLRPSGSEDCAGPLPDHHICSHRHPSHLPLPVDRRQLPRRRLPSLLQAHMLRHSLVPALRAQEEARATAHAQTAETRGAAERHAEYDVDGQHPVHDRW